MKKLLSLFLLVCIAASVFSCGKSQKTGAEQTAEPYVDKYGTNPDGKKVVESDLLLYASSSIAYFVTLYGDGTFDAVSFAVTRKYIDRSNFDYNFFMMSGSTVSAYDDTYIAHTDKIEGVEFDFRYRISGTYTRNNGLYTLKSDRYYFKCDNFRGENAERFLNNYGDLLTGDMKRNKETVEKAYSGEWVDYTDMDCGDEMIKTVTAELTTLGKETRYNYYLNMMRGNVYMKESFPKELLTLNKGLMPVKTEISLGNKGKNTGYGVVELYDNFHKKSERIYNADGTLSYGFDYSFEYYDNNEPKTVTETTIPTNKTRNYKINRYDYYDNGLLKTITKEVAEAHYEREGESGVDPAHKNITEYTYYDSGCKKKVEYYSLYDDGVKKPISDYEWYDISDGGQFKKRISYRYGEVYSTEEYDKSGNRINADDEPEYNNRYEMKYTYYDNGATCKLEYFKGGRLQDVTEYYENGDGKSYIKYDNDGNIEKSITQTYKYEYYDNGDIKELTVYDNDVLNRRFEYYPGGTVKTQKEYLNGEIYYEYEYFESGNIRISNRYSNGILSHKAEYSETGECFISYDYSNGILTHTYEVSADGCTATSTDYDRDGNVTNTLTSDSYKYYRRLFDIYDD